MKGIWIVDDDQSIRWVLERAVQREGLAVRCFDNAQDCLSALEKDVPQVLVSDIRMPGTNGLALLEQVRSQRPALPVIITTAYSDLDSAVSAFRGGAFEYLPKPFDLSHAMELIRRALQESVREAVEHQQEAVTTDMLGQAPAMQEVFRAIGRLASSNVTVLITGESGTGKELVAKALHRHSPRARGTFVALNMAAIPRDLLESELFGHERGSFTGAQQQRRGRFEQADDGKLFLDEIGDMPAELQTRLLRVLADGQYYRVGGQQAIQANVRVIAATHQDLERRVQHGEFREDLFHRLNVIRLRLPPLRERIEDIPLLTKHFLQRSASELKVEVKRLSDDAHSALAKFSWPGNVRQLENACHWITVMAPAQIVEVKDLPSDIKDTVQKKISTGPYSVGTQKPLLQKINPFTAQLGAEDQEFATQLSIWEEDLSNELQRSLADQGGIPDSSQLMDQFTRRFEAVLLKTTLRHTRGRRIDAASRLGIGRNTITRKIQELNLEDDHS